MYSVFRTWTMRMVRKYMKKIAANNRQNRRQRKKIGSNNVFSLSCYFIFLHRFFFFFLYFCSLPFRIVSPCFSLYNRHSQSKQNLFWLQKFNYIRICIFSLYTKASLFRNKEFHEINQDTCFISVNNDQQRQSENSFWCFTQFRCRVKIFKKSPLINDQISWQIMSV